ncbi:hypothetical protein A9264_07045 [Vibrio sp. UCD-FRSSP16_10]|uniref:hypothetical protein n=1 Tax=unclassified Vibrio TaxID=2614977 RepID=UPI0007FDEF36|nr:MULTISPECIES: hypothetical protein [unclassified Vibrio]OBT13418.1 hypothetical protein A9264_07045 [Vibrio sp. UCD-FRSSP16_10]OBT17928.1 hypothetical protein A9260_01035 [Vibrio sp. UCD-FRSSP16_30]
MTFEQWAFIADLYTPLLIVCSVWLLYLSPASRRQSSMKAMVICIAIVYISMAMDEWLSIWPSFGADYSTHSAIALALVVHIVIKSPWLAKWIAVSSLFAYLQLMHHQQYHTYLDMISTLLYLLPMLVVTWLRFDQQNT